MVKSNLVDCLMVVTIHVRCIAKSFIIDSMGREASLYISVLVRISAVFTFTFGLNGSCGFVSFSRYSRKEGLPVTTLRRSQENRTKQ